MIFIDSCTKDKVFEFTDNMPLNWQMQDSFTINTTLKFDSAYSRKEVYCPIGVINDSYFGTSKLGFYASYEYTTNSSSFDLVSVDSIVLLLPYYNIQGKFNNPVDISVYELTENITDSNSKVLNNYTYNPTPVGLLSNFVPNNINDSILDENTKIYPHLRINLSKELANRLIASKGYTSNTELQNVFKGLFVSPSSSTNTNGVLNFFLNNKNKINIYGKSSTGNSNKIEFITGNTNSITVNSYQNDYNGSANSDLNKTNAASNIYLMGGVNGYYSRLNIGNILNFAKNKNIFKAELIFTIVDTSFEKPSNLGVLTYDEINDSRNYTNDQYFNENKFYNDYYTENGELKYKLNIVSFINNSIGENDEDIFLDIFSTPIIISSSNSYYKTSRYLPNRIVAKSKPILKLYYTK